MAHGFARDLPVRTDAHANYNSICQQRGLKHSLSQWANPYKPPKQGLQLGGRLQARAT